ncbi:MAG TPA: hypothetical protein EYN66_15355 [Myxococcales bacterium]|nr:hypothetical protein [Myxococcales bacterium]
MGYVIREVTRDKFDTNYKIGIDKVVAQVCFSGAKANISYDERFFVTHSYKEGDIANIQLVDMLDGSTYQVTDMPTGVKALFPHFRSDGWFYFLVRDGDKEYVIASDLAVKLAAGI